MDFNKLQQKLFQIEPTDRAADKAKMMASMQGQSQQSVGAPQNIVQESVNVPQGTMPVEGNYSISDFAKLAGVTLKKSKQKLVEDDNSDSLNLAQLAQGVKSLDVSDDSAMLVGTALKRAVQGEQLQPAMQDALRPYVELFATIIENPALRTRLQAMDRLLKSKDTDKTLGYNDSKKSKDNDSEKSKEEESIKERLFRELAKRTS